jgi:integrase/recombinase XerD
LAGFRSPKTIYENTIELTENSDFRRLQMAQAKTLNSTDIEHVLAYVETRAHAARNRAMLMLTHLAGLRVGEVACLRWQDVTNKDGSVKEEIRLLPDMTKGRHARTVFVSSKLKAELQACAEQTKCVERSYPFFATQKSIKQGFSANSLTQTLALLYRGAGLEGASSHSGRRSFLTNLANKGTSIHLLKTLAGHRSIQTTAMYLYSSPAQLRAVVELV